MKLAFVLLIHVMVTLTLAAANPADIIGKQTNTAEKKEAILTVGSTGSLEDNTKTTHLHQYYPQTYHYPRYRYPQYYRQPVTNGYYNRYPQRVYYYTNRYPYRPYNRPSVYYNRPSSYSEFSSNDSGSLFSAFGGHHAGENHASHGHSHFGFGHGDAGGHGHDSYSDHSSHGGHSSGDSIGH